MNAPLGSIRALRSALANDVTTPSRLAETALANANRNPGRNTYLWQDAAWTRTEAERAGQIAAAEGGPFGDGRDILWGLPVSMKDCFDLAGAPTTCGTTFYRDKNGIAENDSWIAQQLRSRGAVITGKTHLHPLAYGITGENPEFGDCLQPTDEHRLTGGSSSGACASVMEGSAVAAIGTDTGGSIRVPAALCGLAGYRASLGRGDWRGGAHLAESFDTLGWIFADVEEAPLLGSFFAPSESAHFHPYGGFATVSEDFLHDCEPGVLETYRATVRELQDLGLHASSIEVDWWNDARDIFAPIQAWEAARLHQGSFHRFEPSIRDRLAWGSRIPPEEIATLRKRHAAFNARMEDLFGEHQMIVLPAAPVATLDAGADHTNTRARLLRYTVPFSLAGTPAVTVPGAVGGVQISAAREQDESLLQVVALLGARRKASAPVLNS